MNSNIATAISEVSERAANLVREEIELAKAELSEKISKLIRGAAIGIAAGIFVVIGMLFLFHGLAWLTADKVFHIDPAFGFFIVAGLLFALGIVAGLLAARWVKTGSSLTPELAIDEAKKIRATISNPSEEVIIDGEQKANP